MRQLRFPLFATILLATACGGQPVSGTASAPASNADTIGQNCGGFVGLTCGNPRAYCAFASGTCGIADAAGTCQPRPDACEQVEMPVCGCDGHTYSNDCMAALAGVSVRAKGACASPAQDPISISDNDAGTLVSLLDTAGATSRSVPDETWYAAEQINCSTTYLPGIGSTASCEVVLKDGSSKSIEGADAKAFVSVLNGHTVPARHFVESTTWTLNDISCSVGSFAFPHLTQGCTFTPVVNAD